MMRKLLKDQDGLAMSHEQKRKFWKYQKRLTNGRPVQLGKSVTEDLK